MDDVQFRYETPKGFRDWEQLSYSLAEGPSWPRIDAASGVLTGRPKASDVGERRVVLKVTATFEKRTGKDRQTEDLPDRTCEQVFSIEVKE